MECDVVVYNISESTTQEQIDEATWAFSGTLVARHPAIWKKKTKKSFQCFIRQLRSFCLPPRSALMDEMDNFKSKKMFILVSTLMTWAMTRPQDPVSWRETLISLPCKGNSAKLNVLSPLRRMRLISSSERRISGGDDHIPDSNTTMSWRNLC